MALPLLGSGLPVAQPPTPAQAYIAAVEAADGQALEPAIASAMTTLIDTLVADGNYAALSRAVLPCGPRTLAGALRFVSGGGAATNLGFVSGAYDRLGLIGDGEFAAIDLLTRSGDLPLNSYHQAVWVRTPAPFVALTNRVDIGYGTSQDNGGSWLGISGTARLWRNRNTPAGVANVNSIGNTETGLFASNRTDSTGFTRRRGTGNEFFLAVDSIAPEEDSPTYGFARGVSDPEFGDFPSGLSTARLSWISVGTALASMANLDSALSNYIAAVEAELL